MRLLLFVLALAGVAVALNDPLQYEYLYKGVIATGIPGIRPQVSGMGIKAKLTLQMKSKSYGIAQLEDIEVGEYHDDMKCVNLRKPMPVQFSPLQEYKNELTKPFGVNFAQEKNSVLEVPSTDDEWIVNIRKSIVQILYVEPLKSQMGEQNPSLEAMGQREGHKPSVFSVEEETIFGRCQSQYTITPLHEQLKLDAQSEMERQVEEDTQKSELTEEYYRLVRAIDFDKCHDRVLLQFSGVGNMSKAGNAQFESVQSRSSVGTYLLKGTPQHFRIEKAVIEGDIMMHPFGIKTDRIQTITNQTLILKSVTPFKSALRLPSPTRTIKTWRYEVTSPHSPPSGSPKPWINYRPKSDKYTPMPAQMTLLGMIPTPPVIAQWKNLAQTLLQEVAEQVVEIPRPPTQRPSIKQEGSSVSAYKLYELSQLLRQLPLREVKQIFENTFESQSPMAVRKQALLVDAAAASGAAAPYKVLIEMMKSQKIHSARQVSIFTTLTNNLATPVVIPDILEYIQTLDMQSNPILTSSALVNFATLVHRVCINPSSYNYSMPQPLFGQETCKPQLVLEKFIPFLKHQLERSTQSWERGVIIQALANVGSPHIISVLHPIITGKVDSNLSIRNLAVYGLANKRMPTHVREEVFDILMELVDRLSEPSEVREAAVVTLLTWHPDAAWFQRMARSTWREPSRQMTSFITLIIESIARSTEPHMKEQSNYASFALPMTKPITPSLRRSFISLFSKYEPVNKLSTTAEVAWLTNLRSVIPSEMYGFLSNSFGGFRFNIAEIAVASQGLQEPFEHLMKALKLSEYPNEQQEEEESRREEGGRRIQQQALYRDPENRRRVEREASERPNEELFERASQYLNGSIYLRAFDNMYQYIPLNKEVISKVVGRDATQILSKLLEGTKMNITKYFNPVEVEYFFPTALGLPLMGSVSLPVLQVIEGEVKLVIPGQHPSQMSLHKLMKAENFELLVKTNTKIVSKLIVKHKVMVPWSKTIIESGIDNVKELNLPIYANITMRNTNEIKNLTVNIAPFVEEQFPVMYAHNVPYTAIRSFTPSKRDEIKIITVKEDKIPVTRQSLEAYPSRHGFKAEVSVLSDVAIPSISGKVLELIRNPELLPTFFASPTAKFWQASVILDPSQSQYKNVSASISYMMPRPAQRSGQSNLEKVLDLSPLDTPVERLQKLKSWTPAQSVKALNLQLVLNGTEKFDRYEIVFAHARLPHTSHQSKSYKAQLAVMGTTTPKSSTPKALCVVIQGKTPTIRDIHQLKERLQQSMEQNYQGKVTYGSTCASSKIATFKGVNEVNEERKKIVLEELDNICQYDEYNPVVEMRTAAVYDQGKFNLEFKNVPNYLMNASYIIEDVLRGAYFPFASFDKLDVKNPSNKIELKYFRPLSTDKYTVYMNKPKENSIVTDISAPYWMTRMVPFGGLRMPQERNSEVIFAETESIRNNNCSLTANQAITFDGLNMEFYPEQFCYVMASTRQNYWDVRARYTGKDFWIEIYMPMQNLNATFNFREAYLNGQIVQKNARNNNIQIVRHDNFFEATILDDVIVQVFEDAVYTTPLKDSLQTQLRGVCGDYDNDPSRDRTGPKDCLYTDNQMFVTSWTDPAGNFCDTVALEQAMKPVEQFQETCHKRKNIFTQFIYESSVKTNFQYVYPVLEEQNNICVAIHPVKYCKQGETMIKKQVKEVEAKCWKSGQEPKAVEEHKGGYLSHPINSPSLFKKTLQFRQAVECRM